MPTLAEIKKVFEELPSLEQKPEHLPTVAEIHQVLDELIGKEYKEINRDYFKGEEDTPFYMEFTVPEDSPNKNADYIFYRGRGAVPETIIDRMDYDENDIPYNGETVARLVEGKWEML